MTYEEAVRTIPPGRYRHFKGNDYEVLGIARHSETGQALVVYRALYGEGGVWVRPAEMWREKVTRDGRTFERFAPVAGEAETEDAVCGAQTGFTPVAGKAEPDRAPKEAPADEGRSIPLRCVLIAVEDMDVMAELLVHLVTAR